MCLKKFGKKNRHYRSRPGLRLKKKAQEGHIVRIRWFWFRIVRLVNKPLLTVPSLSRFSYFFFCVVLTGIALVSCNSLENVICTDLAPFLVASYTERLFLKRLANKFCLLLLGPILFFWVASYVKAILRLTPLKVFFQWLLFKPHIFGPFLVATYT